MRFFHAFLALLVAVSLASAQIPPQAPPMAETPPQAPPVTPVVQQSNLLTPPWIHDVRHENKWWRQEKGRWHYWDGKVWQPSLAVTSQNSTGENKFTSYNAAHARALATGKPMVTWVGHQALCVN